MPRKNNSNDLLFNDMNEWVYSGKDILSTTFVKK